MQRGRRWIAWIAGALVVPAMAGCADGGDAAQDTDDGDAPPGALHTLVLDNARLVAKDIDTPAEALAAGYVPEPFCVPGMGVHWVLDEALDGELDPDVPEVVLFRPVGPGILQDDPEAFLGIEHVVDVEGTAFNATDTGPYLFGIPLDGPMAGHGPGMPWHKELHIYLAEGLESGADFPSTQPGIECPPGTTDPGLPV